jgi:hypothetical protein
MGEAGAERKSAKGGQCLACGLAQARWSRQSPSSLWPMRLDTIPGEEDAPTARPPPAGRLRAKEKGKARRCWEPVYRWKMGAHHKLSGSGFQGHVQKWSNEDHPRGGELAGWMVHPAKEKLRHVGMPLLATSKPQ